MASTTAMFTALSGLTANARNLDVIGNNISNVNTTAFKSNRMLFASQFSRNISLGSVPGESTGGTNPAQIGLGVTIAGTQRNFSTGSLQPTGDQRDLAIEGDGFFVVSRGDSQFYTRAGAFRQNSNNDLVNISGQRVMGYGVDAGFNIVEGTLKPLNLPVGQLRLAEATKNVRFSGNLNSQGTIGSQGSVTTLAAMTTVATGNPAAAATDLLTDIDDPATTGSQSLFTAGQFIELRGVEKGGKTLPTARYEVTATSTVQDLMDFFRDSLGINTTTGTGTGVAIDTNGQISITGNIGTGNDIALETADIRQLSAGGALVGAGSPLVTTKAQSANGESIRTTFVAYDSLGNSVNVDLTMVLESRGNGTTWRYFIDSPDDSGASLAVGSGTIAFDSSGRQVADTPINITINRTGTGAEATMGINLNFSSPTSLVTSLGARSELAAVYQDGTPVGTLSSFSVGVDGVITGAFTNGLTRPVGQVAVAKFSNSEGLVDIGNNLFETGPNSGTPVITTPGKLGTGSVVGGSLELSNVDLAEEFVRLIQTQTGYSANSRVISATDQLLQQLLVIGR